MNNYYKKNLTEHYRQLVVLCTTSVVLAAMLTVYVVRQGFTRAQKAAANTFVYSPNGASIHVYSPESQWKIY